MKNHNNKRENISFIYIGFQHLSTYNGQQQKIGEESKKIIIYQTEPTFHHH